MADLTRLWLLRDALRGAAEQAPSGAPLRARYLAHATSEGWKVGSEMGEPSPPPELAAAAADWRELLGRLAERHAGEQIAVRAPAGLLELAAREALESPRFALEPLARNVVIDWPARRATHLRCAFIGLDLDWSPPPPPKTVARFPGGPGSAATSRT